VLTSTGRGVLLASVVSFALAYAVGYTDLAVPAVAGCAAILTAVISVGRTARLSASLTVTPVRIRRGGQATVTVTLENKARFRSPRSRLCLPCGPDAGEVPVEPLAGGEVRTLDLRIPCERRGLVRIGPLILERSDVFGLCRRIAAISDPVSVRVHPMVHPLPVVSSVQSLRNEGSVLRRASPATLTFHTLREYVPGDDLRHVHWRASAKVAASLNNLLVRQHVETAGALTSVLLDTNPRSYAGAPAEAFEVAVELAASILVACAQRGHPVCLGTTGGLKVRNSAGRTDVWRLLDPLATVQADGGRALGIVATEMARTPGLETTRHSHLTVISGPVAEISDAVRDRFLASYGRVVIARIGRESTQRPARVPGARVTTRGRLLAFSAATVVDALSQWRAALPLERG
jgi:uncharacterized protein (DUF58 family)